MAQPILTVEAMRAWEARTWDQGIREMDVIARVGCRLAQRLMEVTQPGDRILLLAGKGHNGDDVRAMVPWMHDRKVTLLSLRQPEMAWASLNTALDASPDWIVEGLFGIGLNRPLEGIWAQVVERINASRARTVSVDVPSGLDTGNGQALGPTIRADETWTIGAVKQGLIAAGVADLVGRLSLVSDVGLFGDPDPQGDLWFGEDADFSTLPVGRPVDAHKGSFGSVQLLAGSRGYHGAAVLAARGATAACPGLVSLTTQPSTYAPIAAQVQNVMVHALEDRFEIFPKTTAWVVGPGLAGSDVPSGLKERIGSLWEEVQVPMIVDASALDWLPKERGTGGALRVITPHPGEAARMLATTSKDIQKDRSTALRRLSELYGGCLVVLKGHQTLVGSATGPVYVNPSGNPWLAQGGAGDVLAGYLGGLLAQRAWSEDPTTCVRYGVWAHGQAADRCLALEGGLNVNHLPDHLF